MSPPNNNERAPPGIMADCGPVSAFVSSTSWTIVQHDGPNHLELRFKPELGVISLSAYLDEFDVPALLGLVRPDVDQLEHGGLERLQRRQWEVKDKAAECQGKAVEGQGKAAGC